MTAISQRIGFVLCDGKRWCIDDARFPCAVWWMWIVQTSRYSIIHRVIYPFHSIQWRASSLSSHSGWMSGKNHWARYIPFYGFDSVFERAISNIIKSFWAYKCRDICVVETVMRLSGSEACLMWIFSCFIFRKIAFPFSHKLTVKFWRRRNENIMRLVKACLWDWGH